MKESDSKLSYFSLSGADIEVIVRFMDKCFKLNGVVSLIYSEDKYLKPYMELSEIKYGKEPFVLRHLIHKYGKIFDIFLCGCNDFVLDVTCELEKFIFSISADDIIVEAKYILEVRSFMEHGNINLKEIADPRRE